MCGKSTGSSIQQIIVGLMQFVESAHLHLVLTIRLLVTLQVSDLNRVLHILPNDPCKENRWLSLFRKVHFLKFYTILGAWEKSGFRKGAANLKSLGTSDLKTSINCAIGLTNCI